jgi:hypothetical protein
MSTEIRDELGATMGSLVRCTNVEVEPSARCKLSSNVALADTRDRVFPPAKIRHADVARSLVSTPKVDSSTYPPYSNRCPDSAVGSLR